MTQDLSRTVGEIGEFGLIDRLSGMLGGASIGDDAAVIYLSGPEFLLATVDALVEGTHFHQQVDPMSIGRHAMAVNISDIAAMGGTPLHALVSLMLPSNTPVGFVERLYAGMQDINARFGVEIVGGNMTATDGALAIDVTMLGTVAKGDVVLRRGAEPGDVLVVTGTLGQTAADRLSARRAQVNWTWTVEPRVVVGRALAKAHLAHAMMDLSDGLASDLHHLCRAGNVGAVIYEESLPISIALRRLCRDLDRDPTTVALSGGEDYELLVALSEHDLHRARELAGEVPLNVVGTVLHPDHGVVIERVGGQRDPLPPAGWTHF